MRPLKDLRVLEAAHLLTLDLYERTKGFPPDERFALTNQLRRAAYSIPFNIAEGTARGDAECRQSLKVSLGSAAELEYGILLSRDLGYLSPADYEQLDGQIGPVKRMLVTFIQRLDVRIAQDASHRTRRPSNGQRPTANGQTPENAP
jgi:four helix bundle protein